MKESQKSLLKEILKENTDALKLMKRMSLTIFQNMQNWLDHLEKH